MDFRKIPNVSLDCVIFGLDDSVLKVLLSRRKLKMSNPGETTIDDWVITGDFVQKSETLTEGARRILNLYVKVNQPYQEQFNTFGNPDRIKNEKDLLWMQKLDIDPRILSVGYISLLSSNLFEMECEALKWFPVRQLPTLGFDHTEIIENAYEYLQKKVLIEPLIFELLPDKFTLNELQIAFEAILDIELDNRNFRKKVLRKKYIVPLDEKKKGNSKKPAQLYIFSKDIYNKIVEKHQLFIF